MAVTQKPKLKSIICNTTLTFNRRVSYISPFCADLLFRVLILTQEECKDYKKMDKFLLKTNRVKVQTMCLKTERIKLAKENMQLKQYIKRYLTELALKGGKERPLSMKLQSEMQRIDLHGKLLNRPVTCIEGALSNAVLHEKRMKLQEKKIKELGSIRAYPRVLCS